MQTKYIVSLFQGYLAAFKSYNLARVTKYYHLPCTLHTPDKVVLINSDEDCQQEFSSIFTQLKQAETNDIVVKRASYSLVTKNIVVVSVDWEFCNVQGEVFADFCAIYHLIMIEDRLQIINVVSHDLSNSLSLDYPFEFVDK